MKLVWPSLAYLPTYVDALNRGWSPDNLRGDAAAREELERIAENAAAFLASLVDLEPTGQIALPDGTMVPRLPGYRQWIWDGEFCGSIGGKKRELRYRVYFDEGAEPRDGGDVAWAARASLRWRSSSPTVDGREAMIGLPRERLDVELRALELKVDWPLLERWLQSPHVVRWWGTQDLPLTAPGQRSTDTEAVITADGKPVGYLCWQTPSPSELAGAGLTDLSGDLADIDILIGEPEYLGRGVGPRALLLLLAKLRGGGVRFAGLGTSTSNRAAIRAFEKAGFQAFRDFDDPQFGPCRYMLAQVPGAVEQPAADGASRPR
jgi:RimJ/RimL family protein N-acetyltransferase